MTTTDTMGVETAAARAALTVPGVVELQPSLRQSLAGAADRTRRALGSAAAPREGGVHAEHTPRTGAWHVEVRCVVHEDRRALDTAREVRDSVRTAVSSHLAQPGTSQRVTTVVCVTRLVGRGP